MHITDIIAQIGLPIFITCMTIYVPLVLLSIMGIVAIVQVISGLTQKLCHVLELIFSLE